MGPLSQSVAKGGTDAALVRRTISTVLAETCKQCGTGVAISCPEENVHLSFMQLQLEVEKLAAGLLAIGLNSGDHVMLWGGNHAYMIVAVYACSKAGLVFSCMNPSLNAEAAADLLEMGDFKAVICFPSVKVGLAYSTLCEICPELEKGTSKGCLKSKKLPALSHVIIAEDDTHYSGAFTLVEVFGLATKETIGQLSATEKSVQPDHLATIQFTSGTTGKVKAVMLSHFQFLNSGLVAARRLYLDQPGEVLCCPMPIYRSPVLCLASMATVACGTKVVYPSPLSLPPTIFKSIQDQKCTCLLSNPIAFHLMLRLPYIKKYNVDSLTSVCLVGEHVPPEMIGAMQQNTNIADVTVGLFLTESGCMPLLFPKDGKPEKLLGSQGKAADHYEVKVVDFSTGSIAAIGSVGEVFFKPFGSSEFLGYHKNKQETESHLCEGWLSTGDVGVMDSDGYVNVLGQKRDLIRGAGGKFVYPWVLERRMALHPNVLGVQVVGVPLKHKTSDSICACIVVKEKGVEKIDANHLRENLCQMCREEKLPEPEHIVIVKDFPRTFSRKVQKFKLRELIPDFIKEQEHS